MYQMTDAALAEAQGYCILHHTVVEDGCSSRALYSRVVPSRAIDFREICRDVVIAAELAGQQMEAAACERLCRTSAAKMRSAPHKAALDARTNRI
jgi:hypothetical protein